MALPIAGIQKLVKNSLGKEVRIGKETAAALGKAAEDYIVGIAKKASEAANLAHRKTIQIEDIAFVTGTKIEAPKQPPTPVPAVTLKTS